MKFSPLAVAMMLTLTSAALHAQTAPSVTTKPAALTATNAPAVADANTAAEIEQAVRESLNNTQAPAGTTVSPLPAASTPTTTSADVPTAAEQGYGNQDAAKEKLYAAEMELLDNTARQKGRLVHPAREGNPISKDKSNKVLLGNLTAMLKDAGVDEKKIALEAARLNAADFHRWASLQLQYRQRFEIVE